MTDKQTKSVSMTFKALYSYILDSYYKKISGIISAIFSIASIVVLILGWGQMAVNQRILFIILGSLFTIVNPIMLAFKAFQQLKLSPSFKKPIVYTFGTDGITVTQEDASQEVKWEQICKISLSKNVLALYTGVIYAFIIPVSELGDAKGKILSVVVQYTANHSPKITNNLKGYLSGKGL